MSLAHVVVHVKPVGGDQAGDVRIEGVEVNRVEPVLENIYFYFTSLKLIKKLFLVTFSEKEKKSIFVSNIVSFLINDHMILILFKVKLYNFQIRLNE